MKRVIYTLITLLLVSGVGFGQEPLAPRRKKAEPVKTQRTDTNGRSKPKELTPEEMLNKGEAAYEKSDYAEAAKWFHKAADQGDPTAQYKLGRMYDNGRGVNQDNSEARKWYRLAAESGNACAQYELGVIYEWFEPNTPEAVRWFRKAADQGNAEAQYKLGIIYYYGENEVPQDLAEAEKWFRMAFSYHQRAAEQGDATAQYNLALMYENGFGVSKNLDEARRWYEKAAAQGDDDAKEKLQNL